MDSMAGALLWFLFSLPIPYYKGDSAKFEALNPKP